MGDQLIMSVPYVSDGPPGRYGRDFHDAMIGAGRIEEAPPAWMDPDANVVSRVIVRFFEHDEGFKKLDIVDTRDVARMAGGAPRNVEEFRRQITDEQTMLDVIGRCIYHAMNPDYI